MKTHHTIWLIFFCMTGQAQKIEYTSGVHLGKNYLYNKDLLGVEYTFKDNRIQYFRMDPVKDLLTVKLAKESLGMLLRHVVVYNIKRKKITWSKGFAPEHRINLTHDYTIYSVFNSNSIDINTGKKLWKIDPMIWYVDDETKIGIATAGSGLEIHKQGKKIQGIDLTTGHILWERDNLDFGLPVRKLNDSTILLTSSGLHTLNLYTGKGWDFSAEVKNNYITAGDAAGFAGEFTLRILAGQLYVGKGQYVHTVRNIASNVLLSGNNIYFTSKEKIYCVTDHGNLVWEHSLPSDYTSTSSIFIKNGLVYIINYGYAEINYKRQEFGKPFITAFQVETGSQQFFHLLNQSSINDFQMNDTTVTVLSDRAITEYSIQDGRLQHQNDTLGELDYFVGERLFVLSQDSTYKSLALSHPNNYCVMAGNSGAYVLRKDLTVIQNIPSENFFINYQNTSRYKFLGTRTETIIINENNEIVGSVKASYHSKLIEKALYDAQGDKLIVVDMNDFQK